MPRAVTHVEESVGNDTELMGVETLRRVLRIEVEGVAGAVVGGEHDDALLGLHLRIEEGQKVAQIAVETVVHILYFDGFGPIHLA